MTLKTVPVTGILYNPDGSVAANAVVVAQLTTVDTDGGVIVPGSVSTTTDAGGVFTLMLWPNSRGVNGSQYLLRGQMPGALPGVLLVNLKITVPDSDPSIPVPVSTITNRTLPSAMSDAKAAMLGAQAAAVQAQQALASAIAVAGDMTNVNAVAADLASIDAAVQNIAAIQAAPGSAQAAATSAATAQAAATATAAAAVRRLRPIGKNVLTTTGNYLAGATDISASSQVRRVTVGPVSRVAVGFHACTTTGAGTEGVLLYPQITRASIEYPLGTVPVPLTVGGRSEWVMDAKTLQVVSDELALAMPASASYDLHLHRRIAYAPLSPTLGAAVSGGNLAPSTTYFYKVTCVDNGVESGPSAEVSGATGASGTLSLPLSWTANPYVDASPGTSYYNIYRGTASGAEVLYDSVPARRKAYLDIGAGQPSAGVTPPAASRLQVDRYANTNESGNTVAYGGDGSDQTGTSGATTGGTPINGPRAAYIVTPTYVLGDDQNRCIVGFFDSIGSGTGISQSLAGSVGRMQANWFDVGLPNWNTINLGIGSTALNSVLNGSQKSNWRQLMCTKGDYVVSNLGFNDFVALTRTWQQLATDHLTFGRLVYNNGGRYVIVNVPPCNTTTDNLLTTANQTQRSQSDRVNYNNWLRNGCRVDGAGAPVLTGGAPSPYVYATFDLASTLEVNAANVLTQDGGYWRVPTTPAFNNVVLTGVPTTTSLAVGSSLFPTSSSTAQGLIGYAVKILTGAAAGQVAFVNASTNTTLTLLASGDTSLSGVAVQGLTIAPAAGDTFQVLYGYGVDGAHMTMQQDTATASAFSAFVAANLPPF